MEVPGLKGCCGFIVFECPQISKHIKEFHKSLVWRTHEKPQATSLDSLRQNKEALELMPKAFEKIVGVFSIPGHPIHLFI